MKIQHTALAITVVNLALTTFLLAQLRPAQAKQQPEQVTPVLRARALEIVDSLGKVRASITIQPPVEMGGKKYPQTVLLRLISSNGKPLVKLGGAEDGAALSLTNQSDEGILMHGYNEGSFFRITHQGKKRVIEP